MNQIDLNNISNELGLVISQLQLERAEIGNNEAVVDIVEHYNKLFKPVYDEIENQQKNLNDIKRIAFDLANNL